MSDISWFDLPDEPGEPRLPVTPKLATDTTTWQDIPVEPIVTTDILQQKMKDISARSPDPELLKRITEQATAFSQMFGMTLEESFQKANALNLSPAPQIKGFGQAIADEWKSAILGTQLGEVGRKLRNTTDSAERVKLQEQAKIIKKEMPTRDFSSKILWGFPQKVFLGGVNLVGQQLSTLASESTIWAENPNFLMDIYKTASEVFTNAITFKARDQAKLLLKTGAEVTGIGRLESGNAYLDMLDAGVPHEIAGPISDTVGTLNTVVEFASDVTFAKLFGPLKGRAKTVLKILAQSLRIEGSVVQLGLRIAAKTAAGIATNLAEEYTQETVTFLAERAAEIDAAKGGATVTPGPPLIDRYKELFKAVPGFLAMGLLPGITEGVRGLTAKTPAAGKAKTEIAPTPMETVRADVAQVMESPTPNVEAAQAVITQAEDAKVVEIAQAEVVTPQMVNDAVELADMQAAVEEQAQVAEPPVIQRDLYHGTPAPFQGIPRTHRAELGIAGPLGGGVSKDVFEGFYTTRTPEGALMYAQNRPENVLPVVLSPDAKVLDLSDSIISQEVLGRQGSIARSGLSSLPAPSKIFPFQKELEAFAIADINKSRQSRGKSNLTEEQINKLLPELDPTSPEWNLQGLSGPILEKYIKKQGYDAIQLGRETIVLNPEKAIVGGSPVNVQASIASGAWVDDLTLGQFAAEPWAKEEIATREDLRDIASYLVETGQATSFDSFVAAAKEIELTPKSEGYYRGIWDSTTKPEVVVDEAGEVDTEAQIDANVTAEEKQANKAAVLSTEVDQLEIDLRDKTVRYILENEQQSVDTGFEMDPEIQKLNIEIEDLQKSVKDLKAQNKKVLAAEKQKRLDAVRAERDKIATLKEKLSFENRAERDKIATLKEKLSFEKRQAEYALRFERASAKTEQAIAVGKQSAEDAAKMEAYKGMQRQKALTKKMIRDILKKPSAGIGQKAIRDIRELQAPYTAKETTSLNKVKKAIKAWQTAHSGTPIVKEAQDILNRQSIKDLTVGELVDLWKQSRDIRKEGATKEKARREAIKARRVEMATKLQSTIPGGMSVKRLEEFAKATTQKKEKAFKRKGKIRTSVPHPLRIFKALGVPFEEAFWDRRKTWEGKTALRQRKWDRVITESKKKTGFSVDDAMHKLPGTDYYVDDLMTYYIQMKDPNGRKAVLYGNDENEANISRLTSELPQKVRDFLDGIVAENSKEYVDVERVQIESKGVAAPKVDNYMSIRRVEDFGKPFAEEIATQAAVRESARIAGNQKGFTIQRKVFKEGTQQARFRTDFMNILAEQITQETQFIESEEWSSDMKWLLEGKAKESKAFLEAMKQKHGQPLITFLKDYVNAVIRPESFNGQSFSGLVSRLFRNLSDAQLMYKLATAVIQVEGPFRSLAALDLNQWHYLIAGLWKGTLSLNKSAEFVYSKAPDMINMAESAAIDPAIQEGREFKHSTEAGMFLQKVHKGLREGGYFLLRVLNKWTIISEWTAIYYANVKKLGEKRAIKAASDAVYMHQPSGKQGDAPRMYWIAKGNSLLAYLQRFSRASNQMGQMIFYDLPKAIKEKKIGNMLGIVTAVAVSAYLQFLRTKKRPPKDPEEYAQAALDGFGDSLGAMTFGAGQAIVSGVAGGYQPGDINPLDLAYQMGDVAKDAYYGNISEKQIINMAKQIMQAAAIPFGAAENLARSAYDFDTGEFRFDPIELFGRRPKGE